MVLSRDGPLTLMYIDSYSSRRILVLPVHYIEFVNCCGVIFDDIMVIYRERDLDTFLNLSLKVLEDSPIYSSLYFTLIIWCRFLILLLHVDLGSIKSSKILFY